jgi:flagellar motor switch protein FliN
MENKAANNMERLYDVEMNVTVRFGKTDIPLRDVVKFGIGTMVELERTIDDPVELLVNNFPFAKGEVVVIDGYYGVRVTEIGSTEERSQTLFPSSKKQAQKAMQFEKELAEEIESDSVPIEPTAAPAETVNPVEAVAETAETTETIETLEENEEV